jgi:hypothetical protein
MKTILSVFAVAVGALLLAGCSTPQTRIEKNPSTYARLTPEQQQLVKQGQIGIGFDADMVKLALGEPDHVNQLVNQEGTNEIWTYVTVEGFDDPFLYGGYYPYARGYNRFRGPYYPYYSFYPYYTLGPSSLAYPARYERTRILVVFRAGRVVSFQNEIR